MTDSVRPTLYFLAGMSRVGITWLSRALNRHPEIAVFGQSRFWGKHFVEPNSDGTYDSMQLERILGKIHSFEWNATIGDGPGCLSSMTLGDFRKLLATAVGKLSVPVIPANVYWAMATAVAESQGARIVIEKTPHHVLHVQRILKEFPDAHLLLLHAEPLVHMAVLKAQSDLKYHPLAAALIWRKYDAAIRSCATDHALNTKIIEVAQLADDPDLVLTHLGSVLGVSNFQWMNGMSKYDFGVPEGILPELDDEDYYWSRKINATDASTPTPSLTNRRVLNSLLMLPGYIIHNIRVSLHEVEGSLFSYYYRWFSGR